MKEINQGGCQTFLGWWARSEDPPHREIHNVLRAQRAHQDHAEADHPGRLTVPPPTAARTPVVPGQDVGSPRATRTAR